MIGIEPLQSLAILLATTPTVLGLIILAALVTGMLAFIRPPIDSQAVFALVPWMVVASALFVFAELVTYPDHFKPLLTHNGAFLSTYIIFGVAWVTMMETSVKPETEQLLPDYLGMMGLGIATVLIVVTLIQTGEIPTERLIWPLAILVGSATFATVAVFVLGTVVIDVLAYASKLSILVVFGHTVDAVARVVGLEVFNSVGHSQLSWYIIDLTAITGTAPIGTQSFVMSWALTYIVLKIGLASFLVLLLASQARDHPIRSSIGFGAIAALGLTSGVTNLLLIVIGGAL